MDGHAIGGCLLRKADSVAGAAKEAWRLGINPGGEVFAFELEKVDRLPHNVLLSRDQCAELGLPLPKGESLARD